MCLCGYAQLLAGRNPSGIADVRLVGFPPPCAERSAGERQPYPRSAVCGLSRHGRQAETCRAACDVCGGRDGGKDAHRRGEGRIDGTACRASLYHICRGWCNRTQCALHQRGQGSAAFAEGHEHVDRSARYAVRLDGADGGMVARTSYRDSSAHNGHHGDWQPPRAFFGTVQSICSAPAPWDDGDMRRGAGDEPRLQREFRDAC